MVSSMTSLGNCDTEASLSPNSQENTERNSGFKTKITKKDSRSACDLRATRDSSPYTLPERFSGKFVSKKFSVPRSEENTIAIFHIKM